MNIKNKDITIRNAEKTDCEQLAIWWNDGKVMAHAGFPNGLGTNADEIRNQISSDMDETKRRLIIDYKGSSIGEMSYYNMGENIAEIGIKICDSLYQEKGLGKKMLNNGFSLQQFDEHPSWEDESFPGEFTAIGIKTCQGWNEEC